MAKELEEELSNEEIAKLRLLMERITFTDTAEEGDDGGNCTLGPGKPREGGDGLHGRIVLKNPGGTTRPFVTIVDGDRELDIYLGAERPASDDVAGRHGSIFLLYDGGDAPRFYRMTRRGWVHVL